MSSAGPEPLYKYTTVKRATEILQTGKVAWTSPALFNDPFDGQWEPSWVLAGDPGKEQFVAWASRMFGGDGPVGPDFRPEIREAILKIRDKLGKMSAGERSAELARQVEAAWQRIVRHIGRGSSPRQADQVRRTRVFCVSAEPRSILMWSHYAERHRGVVFALRTEVLEGQWPSKARKVNYADMVPNPVTPDELLAAMSSGQRLYTSDQILDAFIFTKFSHWAFEAEYRFAAMEPPDPPELFTLIDLPANAVEFALLGCEAADADADEIKRLLGARFPGAALHRLRRDRMAFSLQCPDGPFSR